MLILEKIDLFVKFIFIKIISFYQKTFSPDHGIFKSSWSFGVCKYRPTCSEYAIETLKSNNLIIALPKIMWRLLRCNPWSHGGWDPPK